MSLYFKFYFIWFLKITIYVSKLKFKCVLQEIFTNFEKKIYLKISSFSPWGVPFWPWAPADNCMKEFLTESGVCLKLWRISSPEARDMRGLRFLTIWEKVHRLVNKHLTDQTYKFRGISISDGWRENINISKTRRNECYQLLPNLNSHLRK